jgi:hypothetical protein
MAQIEVTGGAVAQLTLKSYDGSRWDVIAGTGADGRTAVKNLYTALFEMFPEELGPILQTRGEKNYVQVTTTAQHAFAERVARGQEFLAKGVVKEKLGGRVIDDEPEARARDYEQAMATSRRRSEPEPEEPPADPWDQPVNRRSNDDHDERHPAQRSYGAAAAEPDDGEYCRHGEMVKREGQGQKGPWAGAFCPLPKEKADEQCPPRFKDRKTGAYVESKRR